MKVAEMRMEYGMSGILRWIGFKMNLLVKKMKSFNTKKNDGFIRLKVRVSTIWIMINKSYISLPPYTFIGCEVKNDNLATS
jgi:hypothetical protein